MSSKIFFLSDLAKTKWSYTFSKWISWQISLNWLFQRNVDSDLEKAQTSEPWYKKVDMRSTLGRGGWISQNTGAVHLFFLYFLGFHSFPSPYDFFTDFRAKILCFKGFPPNLSNLLVNSGHRKLVSVFFLWSFKKILKKN